MQWPQVGEKSLAHPGIAAEASLPACPGPHCRHAQAQQDREELPNAFSNIEAIMILKGESDGKHD